MHIVLADKVSFLGLKIKLNIWHKDRTTTWDGESINALDLSSCECMQFLGLTDPCSYDLEYMLMLL